MTWTDLRKDTERLCQLLNTYSSRGVKEKFKLKINSSSIRRWANQNGIKYDSEDGWYLKEGGPTKTVVEEELHDYVEDESENIEVDGYDTYYHIYNSTQEEQVSKHKLEKIYEWYCEDGLTQDETKDKARITMRQFKFIRKAFGFVHNSIAHPDHQFKEHSIEEIVDTTLSRQKAKYKNVYNAKELRRLKSIEKKFQEKRFFYNKVRDEMVVPIEFPDFNVNIIESTTEGLLVLSDWHTGLKVKNYWNEFSVELQEEIVQDLLERSVVYLKRHKTKNVHVMCLGDLIHGIIHVSTRVIAEVDVVQQIRIAWQLVARILKRLAKELEVVYVYWTYGNHARITEKKTDSIDRENLELVMLDTLKEHLQNFDNIKFIPNEYDEQIIVAEPCGHTVFGVHGDRDRNKKTAENLTMMLEMKPYKIYTAHGHHFEMLETHGVDVIMNRALCGVDDFSKSIRKTAKSGQSLHIYNPDRLESKYDMEFN